MRHLCKSRKLGRNPAHRKAMIRSLALALIEKESIKTTVARAKELRQFAEKLLTFAKRGDLHSRRRIIRMLGSTVSNNGKTNRVRTAISKLYSKLVPRFQTRNGGYTQIFKLTNRRSGDNAELAIIRYIPPPEEKKGKQPKKPTKKETVKKTSEVKEAASDDKESKKEVLNEETKNVESKKEKKKTSKKTSKKVDKT